MRPSARRPARERSPLLPSTAGLSLPRLAGLAGLGSCALLAACATGGPPPAGSAAFELVPPVRELAAAVAPALPEQPLRAYALSIRTVGAGPQARVDVLGRQSRLPGGPLVVVTGSQGAGVFGMTRSLGLCGLVSLRLDTALAERAYLPGDPALAGDIRFTDDARLDVAVRMRVTEMRVDGTPCAPRAAEGFAVVLRTRSELAGKGETGGEADAGREAAAGTGTFAEARYDCLAAPAAEPASLLHPDLPGDMLRVECRRRAGPGGTSGHLSYAWIVSSAVYLLTGHRGQDIAQDYVYTDVVLGP